MFVAEDAREKLIERRKEGFVKQYLKPMMDEAEKLKLTKSDIDRMIEEERK